MSELIVCKGRFWQVHFPSLLVNLVTKAFLPFVFALAFASRHKVEWIHVCKVTTTRGSSQPFLSKTYEAAQRNLRLRWFKGPACLFQYQPRGLISASISQRLNRSGSTSIMFLGSVQASVSAANTRHLSAFA